MANTKRSGKFYRDNEKEIMESLGFKPTKNSGSGWIEKEDGQNDYLICQLKSTDAQSIKVNQKDIRILERNAAVAHKIPVFAIQFLNTGEVWLMAKPEDFSDVSEFIEVGEVSTDRFGIDLTNTKEETVFVKHSIKSSKNAREAFHDEENKKWDRTKSAK